LYKLKHKPYCCCIGNPTGSETLILNSGILPIYLFALNVQALELYQGLLVQIVVVASVLQVELMLEILSKMNLEISSKQTAIGGNVVLNFPHRMTLSR
jgi:hypothetical protein